MKPALAFVGAFVVAAAASTGVSMKLHPARPVPADSTASDSAAADSAGGDSLAKAGRDSGARPADSTPTAKTPPLVPPAATDVPAPASAGRTAASPNAPSAGPNAPTKSASPDSAIGAERRLAKIFSSMDPADAAKTLVHMTDPDVQVILGYVSERQAAAILAAMPPDRVATIGKLALHGRGQ